MRIETKICVADNRAKAVVVVTQAGELRFKYTGPRANAFPKESFDLIGITTDSQGRILTADQSPYPHHRSEWTVSPLH